MVDREIKKSNFCLESLNESIKESYSTVKIISDTSDRHVQLDHPSIELLCRVDESCYLSVNPLQYHEWLCLFVDLSLTRCRLLVLDIHRSYFFRSC